MTGIFFGSTTGTTESVAARIAERLGVAQADVHNVAAASVEDVKKYDLLLLGSSTWGSGELQDDWPGFLDKLGKEDLSGRRVALFGCGDAGIYSDTFCDAMAEIRDGLAAVHLVLSCFDGLHVRRGIRRRGVSGVRFAAVSGRRGDRLGRGRQRVGRREPDADGVVDRRHRLKPNAMSAGDFSRYDNMKMLLHHIYEFRKGVRDLVLCTLCPTCAGLLIERLRSQGIDYLLQPVTEQKVNLYFGKRSCLDAVQTFVDKPLNKLTPEEDFMLGIMLGYDISMQCERYCKRKFHLSGLIA